MSDTNIDDGGPAFPTPDCSEWNGPDRVPGMSLRDYLAGQALATVRGAINSEAMYRNDSSELPRSKVKGFNPGNHEIAARAYELADAMIAARKVKP